jgi:hypothetical protein
MYTNSSVQWIEIPGQCQEPLRAPFSADHPTIRGIAVCRLLALLGSSGIVPEMNGDGKW